MKPISDKEFSLIIRISRNNTKLNILKVLTQKKTPSQIAKQLDIDVTSASRSMRKLQKDGLIKCVNPNQSNYRYYKITNKFKKIMEEVKGIMFKDKPIPAYRIRVINIQTGESKTSTLYEGTEKKTTAEVMKKILNILQK